jgi:hypothetical protein
MVLVPVPIVAFPPCCYARAGRRVALIDEARFPRHKVCGSGVSRKSIARPGLDLDRVVHRWLAGALERGLAVLGCAARGRYRLIEFRQNDAIAYTVGPLNL